MDEDHGQDAARRHHGVAGHAFALRERAPDWIPTAGPAVVLGAGGAARAVVAALSETRVEEIRLANRTAARAELLADDLAAPATRITIHPWEERATVLRDAGILV